MILAGDEQGVCQYPCGNAAQTYASQYAVLAEGWARDLEDQNRNGQDENDCSVLGDRGPEEPRGEVPLLQQAVCNQRCEREHCSNLSENESALLEPSHEAQGDRVLHGSLQQQQPVHFTDERQPNQ